MNDYKEFETQSILHQPFAEIVNASIEDLRNFFTKIIDTVENIDSKPIKLLTYFSLIESIAQDVANYPLREQHIAFTNFVLKYQNSYTYLEDVDPVSLYYRTETYIGKEFNLNNLDDGMKYLPTHEIICKTTQKLKQKLISALGIERAKSYFQQHRYVDLLYRMRCGLSHEFSSSHIALSTIMQEPYYQNCSRYYLKNKKIFQDNVWKLNIPTTFIKKLCENCIENYLNECMINNTMPLPNNAMIRFCELSWYNKI